jgi:cytochrome d ubiquinol oxidase subunit II
VASIGLLLVAPLRARPASPRPWRSATILIGWAVAQYPYLLLPYLTIEEAAQGRATLVAMTVVLIAGSVLLVPGADLHVLCCSPAPRTAQPTSPCCGEVGGSVTAR